MGERLTAEDLRKMEPLYGGNDWLVERFIPRGELGTLFADSGTGKTMLFLDVVISCLTGTRCMDRLESEHIGAALWLNQDMGEGKWRERVRRIFSAKDPGHDDVSPLYAYHDEGIQLDTGEGRKTFKGLLSDHEPDLVVLDSLQQHMKGDPSKLEDVRDMMASVRNGMETNPCTVVFIAHTNREGDYYGSQANEADVDFTWQAERRGQVGAGPDNVVVTKRKARNVQPMTGFEFYIRQETLESEWLRPLKDKFTVKERMDVFAALDFAHAVEQDEDEDEIKVASFIREMADQMGKSRARKTFDTLAKEAGLLRLCPRRGERGAHIYEVTKEGREWYENELQYAEEYHQKRFTVEEEMMGEEDLVEAVDEVTEEDTPEKPEPSTDALHVEDEWIEPPSCKACGAPGHNASNCPSKKDDGGPGLDDVMDDPLP